MAPEGRILLRVCQCAGLAGAQVLVKGRAGPGMRTAGAGVTKRSERRKEKRKRKLRAFLSFLSAWSNSSPSLVYRPCALAGAARLQRLSEAEPLDGSFVRGAKTWAPRAGARARSLTVTLSLRLLDLRRGVTRPQEAYNISRMPLCVTSAYVCTRPNRHTAPLVQYQTYTKRTCPRERTSRRCCAAFGLAARLRLSPLHRRR